MLALAANRPYGLDVTKGETVQRLPTTFAPLGAGSTFKIFTAAAAMEMGLGTNATIDVPAEYTSPAGAHRASFKNAGSYPASMTLAQALATSPNTAFVALEDQVGLQKVAEMAVRLGMRGLLAGRRSRSTPRSPAPAPTTPRRSPHRRWPRSPSASRRSARWSWPTSAPP